jgi:Fur family ferric uptake transcriptional regulator
MHISADSLIDTLRRNDMRITEPRRLVCTVIAEHHDDHLTAQDIFDTVSGSDDGDIDMATVYRTLEALEDSGAIKHGHIGHGPTVYHLTEESDHQHLVCSSCGSTIAVSSDDIGAFLTSITDATGFVPDVEHFALTGRCRNCAEVQST